ncbi:hypothetical protein REPUB_Repub01dG0214100 [Reevesia pubescens]
MANYLNFDIHDLELIDIHTNSDLRIILIATRNRSILVVEDIDCSLELQERQTEPRLVAALKLNSNNASQVNKFQLFLGHVYSNTIS